MLLLTNNAKSPEKYFMSSEARNFVLEVKRNSREAERLSRGLIVKVLGVCWNG